MYDRETEDRALARLARDIENPPRIYRDNDGPAMGTVSMLIILAIALTGLCVLLAAGPASSDDMDDFFHALAEVESGHDDSAVGDGGASIGRYQIQRPYWIDSRIPGEYEHVKGKAYAERVMLAYWKRYAPQALKDRDWETLARIHNGGPRGHKKQATVKYWAKVQAAMNN